VAYLALEELYRKEHAQLSCRLVKDHEGWPAAGNGERASLALAEAWNCSGAKLEKGPGWRSQPAAGKRKPRSDCEIQPKSLEDRTLTSKRWIGKMTWKRYSRLG
jgi:hypothetical protein